MVAVLAAITGVANAAMTTPTAGVEGHIWTWDGNNWTKDDGTVSSPTRDADTGAFVIFEADKKSQNPEFGNTSDGGGVWVKDNVNVSDISLGQWGGTIQINAGAYLDAWASQLKSEVVNDTTANVWVEGVLNLRGFNNFDGAANQKWHIGKDGMIVLPNTTISSLNKKSKQWHIELVHQIIDQEEIEGIVNRTRKEITQTRTYLQTQEDLSSSLDSLTVLDVNGNVLEKDVDYSIQNSQSSLGISYKVIGYENVDLTWKGVDGSKWEHAGAAWIDANGEVTSFINGDNVVFDVLSGDVTNTVLLSGNLTVGNMEVKDNYTFVTKENVTLRAGSIAVSDNKTLTKSGDASLVVQGSINGNVAVTGGTLEVSGANAINGSMLDITNAKVVATLDTASDVSVINHGTQVNIGTGGTLELNGHDMLGWGRGTAPSFILGSADADKMAQLVIKDSGSNTFGAAVTMKGNSKISGNAINTFFVPLGNDNNVAVSVTGKNNKIDVSELQIRSTKNNIAEWKVDVGESGELTIDSKIQNHADGSSAITKLGQGKLILTHIDSEWSNTLNVNAGVVQLKESASLKGASVVVSASGTIELGTGSVKNLTLSDNSSLVLNAYGEKAAFVIGSLSLGVNLTLDTTTMQRIVGLQKDESLIIFQSVTDLVLGGDESQLATADSVTGTIGVDAAAYFKGLEANTYYLNLVGGNVSITKQIPEPTTVTLSLLALAGLAARRRRK